ncbi:Kinase [Hexamita inflata]|uniref:non-specific serine/threonine protein kinase n=1 Tax=Hexamita inflata TaxID=28002 RepID=A0AA86R8W2_9EUKA|nr:CMGC SRPK [Hexamita inflata]
MSDQDEYRDDHSVDEGSAGYQSTASSKYCDIDILVTQLTSPRGNTYIPIRKVSHGHFSTVYLSFCQQTQEYVAVKICRCDPSYESAFDDELYILRQLQQVIKEDSCIVNLLDWFIYEQTSLDDDFQETNNRHYCIVMELLGHSLYKLLLRYSPRLNANKALPIPIVKTISKCLLKGLSVLHSSGFIHTDIKPENIALQYYLPEITPNSDYKLPELIFGQQSQFLFDAKLCTPANSITMNDFDALSYDDKNQVGRYLTRQGEKQNVNDWLQIQLKIMNSHNYKQLFQRFLKDNPAAQQTCYKIGGMNIFNVQNLMKEAEKAFRVSYIPGDVPNTSIKENNKQVTLKFMKFKLKKPGTDVTNITDTYDLIQQAQIKNNFVLSTQLGLEITLSHVSNNFQQKALYVEKLYFDDQKPQSIHKLASSGLHSRFSLMKMLQDQNSNDVSPQMLFSFNAQQDNNQILILPKYPNKHDQKCFALSQNGQALYPTLVSYFSKKSLIPFCEEMFKCKLLDLGNAYSIAKHSNYTIQTRQYRAPEVILGCQYNEKVDIFSAACVIFEMLVGNYLFQTKSHQTEIERDHEHLEQIVKIVGEHGLQKILQNADQAKLQKIGKIKIHEQTPISSILVNQYNFLQNEALAIEQFLEPMLKLDYDERISCADAQNLLWLSQIGDGDYLTGYGGRQ